MQKPHLIIGSIVLVVATLVTFGVLNLLSNPALLVNQRCEEIKYVDVLMAKEDIHLGDPINLSLLEYERWPQKITKNDFFIKEKVTPETFSGFVARRTISAGEPITKNAIVESKNQGALAALLKPGMRALAINVEAASVNGGLVMPGDIVDVIITYPQGTGLDQRYISQTALCEVRVLALDQKVSSDSDPGSLTSSVPKKDAQTTIPRTVTLELQPEDVERLTAAVKKGTPSLSLHSVAAGQSKCRVNFSDALPLSQPVAVEPEVKPTMQSVHIMRGSDFSSSGSSSPGKY